MINLLPKPSFDIKKPWYQRKRGRTIALIFAVSVGLEILLTAWLILKASVFLGGLGATPAEPNGLVTGLFVASGCFLVVAGVAIYLKHIKPMDSVSGSNADNAKLGF